MLDILKSPLLLGLIAAIGIYTYMYWEKAKEYRNNPTIKRKRVNILMPGIIGIIVWFIASSYMCENLPQIKNIPMYHSKNIVRGALDEYPSGSILSYHLIKDNNIKMPNTDVFMELAPF